MTVLVSSLKGVKNNHKWQTNGAVMWRGRKADKYGVRGLACEAITGTGKTYFAMLCAKDWLKQHGASLARIVVVVPTEPLQKQWYLLFGQQNMANVSRQGGNNTYSGFAPIVVVIQNSLKRLEDHQNLVGKKVLYILDEAHRAASKTNLKLLKRIRHKQQMQGCIAISATLERPDGNNIMDITGSDKDGEAHIKYGYGPAVADGVIPPFRIHVYETTDSDLTMAEDQQLRDYNKWIAIAYSKCLKNSSIHTGLLMSHLMDSYEEVQDYRKFTRLRKQFLNDLEVRYEIAESLMMEYSGTGEKVALFHETIKGIERISQAAIESGLDKPFIYHSGETPDDIDECTSAELKRYKEYARNRKKILATWVSPLTEGGILLTCKALKEGLDVPEMDALIMLSHPNNPTPLIQATGRALRGNKNSDKQWVNRHGIVIDEENPKNIYIVVQAGTTDANCIPNMQVKGDIPLERFVHYRRQGGVWTPIHGVVTPANDLLLDEPPIDDEPYNIEDEPPIDDYEDEPPMDEDTPAIHLAVIGWRNMKNEEHFNSTLDDYISANSTPTTIISGGQTGADTLARKYANANGITFVEHSHMTYAYMGSPKMYHHRNQLIVNDATHMIAFPYPQGSGTQSCMKRANKKGIPVMSFNPIPALEFNATTGEMQPATSAHQIGGIQNE